MDVFRFMFFLIMTNTSPVKRGARKGPRGLGTEVFCSFPNARAAQSERKTFDFFANVPGDRALWRLFCLWGLCFLVFCLWAKVLVPSAKVPPFYPTPVGVSQRVVWFFAIGVWVSFDLPCVVVVSAFVRRFGMKVAV